MSMVAAWLERLAGVIRPSPGDHKAQRAHDRILLDSVGGWCAELNLGHPGSAIAPDLQPLRASISVARLPSIECEDTARPATHNGDVAQAHFNVGSMKIAPLPLPPVEEQVEIVRRVESLFALADAVEAKWQAARAQVERLTPALLARAFRGELVPQDPNDEPASALLARLHGSLGSAAAPARKRSRRQVTTETTT